MSNDFVYRPKRPLLAPDFSFHQTHCVSRKASACILTGLDMNRQGRSILFQWRLASIISSLVIAQRSTSNAMPCPTAMRIGQMGLLLSRPERRVCDRPGDKQSKYLKCAFSREHLRFRSQTLSDLERSTPGRYSLS